MSGAPPGHEARGSGTLAPRYLELCRGLSRNCPVPRFSLSPSLSYNVHNMPDAAEEDEIWG